MNKVTIYINDIAVTAAEGESILEAARKADIYIPHICSHPDLTPQGGCKLCIVEIEGLDKPVCSCETMVEEGMVVKSNTDKLNKMRSVSMELMLAGHPHDCTSCKAYMNCELQALMQYLGTVHARMRDIHKKNTKINVVNPLIVREMERCIQCGRCVRACNELRQVDAIDYKKKDNEFYIGTDHDLPFVDTDCRFCGACIQVCPTGALQDAEGTFRTDIPKDEALIPCQAECPAHIDIPSYVRLVSEGKYSDAVGVIREKVPFPHALGFVCNHRCETGCKREKLNEAISIRDLKRFAVEHDTEMTWKAKDTKKPSTGKKVGVVGAGATGLTAAYYLNKLGHSVTVYEKGSLAGGMMTYGMPEYRIPEVDIQKEISYIIDQGVKLVTNTEVGSVTNFKEDGGYDSVLVAIGASYGRRMNLPGSDLQQVYTAIEILKNIRRHKDMDIGKTTTIIGGGNVAFDCARSLVRKGKNVNVVCLEKGSAMLADDLEIKEGLEEGIKLYDGYTNIEIQGNEGKVTGLHIREIKGFHFDEQRKLVCEEIPDSDQVLATDSVVFAAGQMTGLTEAFGIGLNRFGFPDADMQKLSTSVDGVFAAGDVMTGTRFVIDAIAAGRRAATAIDQYLGGDGNIDETYVERDRHQNIGVIEDFSKQPRVQPEVLSVDDRKNSFDRVDLNFPEKEAVCESSRCLQCDLRVTLQPVKNWNAYGHK